MQPTTIPTIPTAKLPGIDISHYQTITSWPTVAEQVKFCFIKATDGTKYVDPSLPVNTRGCADHGIPFGLYHFFRSTACAREADHFLEAFAKYPSQLPPVLDVEVDCAGVSSQALMFLDRVAAVVQPIVYTYSYFAAAYLTAELTKFPLWIANMRSIIMPGIRPWKTYAFWQWKTVAEFDGIDGAVDLDWCADQQTLDSLLRLPT